MATLLCPASVSQRLLWMATRRFGTSAAMTPRHYLIPDVSADALIHALADLVARHEALRTRFTGAGDGLTQEILPPEPPAIEWLPCEDVALAIDDAPRRNIGTVTDGAMRVEVLHDAQNAILVLEIDHLLTDAWSYDVIRAELGALYRAYLSDQQPELPDVGWQYRDFAEWQVARLRGATLAKYQDEWLRRLTGAHAPGLPTPVQRPPRRERLADVQRLIADPDRARQASDGLRTLGACGTSTLSTAALAVFFLLLALITGEDDLTISSIFANRMNAKCWRTVGPFAHPLPLRLAIGHRDTVRDLVRAAHNTMAHALANQELPMPLLPSGELHRSVSAAISNVVFHVLPVGQAGLADGGPGVFRSVPRIPRGVSARFDLELQLIARPSGLGGFVRFAADRFPEEWIAAFRDGFCDLIALTAADPDRSVDAIAAAYGPRFRELATL